MSVVHKSGALFRRMAVYLLRFDDLMARKKARQPRIVESPKKEIKTETVTQ